MKYVPTAITRTVAKTALRTQQKSPTLLFAAGLVGVVGATVLACRATLKSQPVLADSQEKLLEVTVHENRSLMTEDEAARMRRAISIKTTLQVTRVYAPAIGVGVISLILLTKSHRQLTQRNAALTAAFVALQNFLEEYRGRVRAEVGDEGERKLYYGAQTVELAEDTANGPKKILGTTPGNGSPYSCVFDESNHLWNDNADYNYHLIALQERFLTDKLRAQGYLFLSEVYKALDIPETPVSRVAGWFVGYPGSDDFVEITTIPIHDFHGSLLLDFNVAGAVDHMLTGKRS